MTLFKRSISKPTDVYSESAFVEELSTHRPPLALLGDAIEEILTQNRLIPQ
jgi:hypothetical protein